MHCIHMHTHAGTITQQQGNQERRKIRVNWQLEAVKLIKTVNRCFASAGIIR